MLLIAECTRSTDYVPIPLSFGTWDWEKRVQWYQALPKPSRAQKRNRRKTLGKSSVAPESLASGPVVPLESSAVQSAPETYTLFPLESSILIPVTPPPEERTMSPRPGVSHVTLGTRSGEPLPVPHSTCSYITLAQYKVNNPLVFQPIVREIGLGENAEGNTIPISPPPLGLVMEVSSIPEGQNIRRKFIFIFFIFYFFFIFIFIFYFFYFLFFFIFYFFYFLFLFLLFIFYFYFFIFFFFGTWSMVVG